MDFIFSLYMNSFLVFDEVCMFSFVPVNIVIKL